MKPIFRTGMELSQCFNPSVVSTRSCVIYLPPLGGASLACRAVDGGYAGDKLKDALKGKGKWTIEVIKRTDDMSGFVVLPRRWVVERTFAWLGRCRRLAKDYEASIESATAWTLIAHIRMIIRKLARYCYA